MKNISMGRMRKNLFDAFITDGHWRKTLAAVRALGREGLGVAVGESTTLAVSAFSRYCRKRVIYPSALATPDLFVSYVHDFVFKHAVALLLPMEDETVQCLSRHRDTLSQRTYLPVASPQQLSAARNKAHVIQLAENLGIPVPRTWILQDLGELDRIKDALPYPVVVKPRTGAGAVGVLYLKDKHALLKQYPALHRLSRLPIIQETIPRKGPGYGVSLLMDENSRVKAGFVHKRLREYPVSGGASTLRVSVRNDEIYEMAVSLLKALEWFGVAMVEFKIDPRDGRPKLMEINPRFWGSLALAVHAGVNFPHLLYRMALKETFKPVEKYRLNVKCRWLLPGDLLHFVYNPDRRRLANDFFGFAADDTHYDILSLKDPVPAVVKVLTPLTFLFDADMKMRLKRRKAFSLTQ
jgi:predicted ATP-grasp superfamily ATP-dependent carboligase